MPVPSQEKTYQGHHMRKHVKAITGEIVSGPSHEKACPTPATATTRENSTSQENMSEPSHKGGHVG